VDLTVNAYEDLNVDRITLSTVKLAILTLDINTFNTSTVTVDQLRTENHDGTEGFDGDSIREVIITHDGDGLFVGAGGSPFFQSVNAVTLTLEGDGDMTFGSETGTPFAGFSQNPTLIAGDGPYDTADESDDLVLVDASGLTGSLDLGEMAVYQDLFTVEGGTGAGNALTLAAGELAGTGEENLAVWTFNLQGADFSEMTLNGVDEDLAFQAFGVLNITVDDLIINGGIDFSALGGLNFNDDIEIYLSNVADDGLVGDEAGEAGASLTITADQLMTAAADEVGLTIIGDAIAENTLTINANDSLRAFSQMDFDGLSAVEHLVFDVPFGPVPYDGFTDHLDLSGAEGLKTLTFNDTLDLGVFEDETGLGGGDLTITLPTGFTTINLMDELVSGENAVLTIAGMEDETLTVNAYDDVNFFGTVQFASPSTLVIDTISYDAGNDVFIGTFDATNLDTLVTQGERDVVLDNLVGDLVDATGLFTIDANAGVPNGLLPATTYINDASGFATNGGTLSVTGEGLLVIGDFMGAEAEPDEDAAIVILRESALDMTGGGTLEVIHGDPGAVVAAVTIDAPTVVLPYSGEEVFNELMVLKEAVDDAFNDGDYNVNEFGAAVKELIEAYGDAFFEVFDALGYQFEGEDEVSPVTDLQAIKDALFEDYATAVAKEGLVGFGGAIGEERFVGIETFLDTFAEEYIYRAIGAAFLGSEDVVLSVDTVLGDFALVLGEDNGGQAVTFTTALQADDRTVVVLPVDEEGASKVTFDFAGDFYGEDQIGVGEYDGDLDVLDVTNNDFAGELDHLPAGIQLDMVDGADVAVINVTFDGRDVRVYHGDGYGTLDMSEASGDYILNFTLDGNVLLSWVDTGNGEHPDVNIFSTGDGPNVILDASRFDMMASPNPGVTTMTIDGDQDLTLGTSWEDTELLGRAPASQALNVTDGGSLTVETSFDGNLEAYALVGQDVVDAGPAILTVDHADRFAFLVDSWNEAVAAAEPESLELIGGALFSEYIEALLAKYSEVQFSIDTDPDPFSFDVYRIAYDGDVPTGYVDSDTPVDPTEYTDLDAFFDRIIADLQAANPGAANPLTYLSVRGKLLDVEPPAYDTGFDEVVANIGLPTLDGTAYVATQEVLLDVLVQDVVDAFNGGDYDVNDLGQALYDLFVKEYHIPAEGDFTFGDVFFDNLDAFGVVFGADPLSNERQLVGSIEELLLPGGPLFASIDVGAGTAVAQADISAFISRIEPGDPEADYVTGLPEIAAEIEAMDVLGQRADLTPDTVLGDFVVQLYEDQGVGMSADQLLRYPDDINAFDVVYTANVGDPNTWFDTAAPGRVIDGTFGGDNTLFITDNSDRIFKAMDFSGLDGVENLVFEGEFAIGSIDEDVLDLSCAEGLETLTFDTGAVVDLDSTDLTLILPDGFESITFNDQLLGETDSTITIDSDSPTLTVYDNAGMNYKGTVQFASPDTFVIWANGETYDADTRIGTYDATGTLELETQGPRSVIIGNLVIDIDDATTFTIDANAGIDQDTLEIDPLEDGTVITNASGVVLNGGTSTLAVMGTGDLDLGSDRDTGVDMTEGGILDVDPAYAGTLTAHVMIDDEPVTLPDAADLTGGGAIDGTAYFPAEGEMFDQLVFDVDDTFNGGAYNEEEFGGALKSMLDAYGVLFFEVFDSIGYQFADDADPTVAADLDALKAALFEDYDAGIAKAGILGIGGILDGVTYDNFDFDFVKAFLDAYTATLVLPEATDLGSFGIELLRDSVGQEIVFTTEDQADGREVTVEDGATILPAPITLGDANVAFDFVAAAASITVDASGYSADLDYVSVLGTNDQDLTVYDLAGGPVVLIGSELGAIDVGFEWSDPATATDIAERTYEIEATDGALDLTDGQTTTVTLDAAVEDAWMASFTGTRMTDLFITGENLTLNGLGHFEGEALTVTNNSDGMFLVDGDVTTWLPEVTFDAADESIYINGTITFDNEAEGSTGILNAEGTYDVSIKQLDFSAANVTDVLINNDIYYDSTEEDYGTLHITGGSPAMILDDVETITITTEADYANTVFGGGSAIPGVPMVESVNMMIILDLSLSMDEGNKLEDAKAAAIAAIDEFAAASGGDTGVRLVTFSDGATSNYDSNQWMDPTAAIAAINTLDSLDLGDGTYYDAALNEAMIAWGDGQNANFYTENALNSVFFITDGAPSPSHFVDGTLEGTWETFLEGNQIISNAIAFGSVESGITGWLDPIAYDGTVPQELDPILEPSSTELAALLEELAAGLVDPGAFISTMENAQDLYLVDMTSYESGLIDFGYIDLSQLTADDGIVGSKAEIEFVFPNTENGDEISFTLPGSATDLGVPATATMIREDGQQQIIDYFNDPANYGATELNGSFTWGPNGPVFQYDEGGVQGDLDDAAFTIDFVNDDPTGALDQTVNGTEGGALYWDWGTSTSDADVEMVITGAMASDYTMYFDAILEAASVNITLEDITGNGHTLTLDTSGFAGTITINMDGIFEETDLNLVFDVPAPTGSAIWLEEEAQWTTYAAQIDHIADAVVTIDGDPTANIDVVDLGNGSITVDPDPTYPALIEFLDIDTDIANGQTLEITLPASGTDDDAPVTSDAATYDAADPDALLTFFNDATNWTGVTTLNGTFAFDDDNNLVFTYDDWGVQQGDLEDAEYIVNSGTATSASAYVDSYFTINYAGEQGDVFNLGEGEVPEYLAGTARLEIRGNAVDYATLMAEIVTFDQAEDQWMEDSDADDTALTDLLTAFDAAVADYDGSETQAETIEGLFSDIVDLVAANAPTNGTGQYSMDEPLTIILGANLPNELQQVYEFATVADLKTALDTGLLVDGVTAFNFDEYFADAGTTANVTFNGNDDLLDDPLFQFVPGDFDQTDPREMFDDYYPVVLNPATDLGYFTLQLRDSVDGDNSLSEQVVMTNADQASRVVELIKAEDDDQEEAINGSGSKVIWHFLDGTVTDVGGWDYYNISGAGYDSELETLRIDWLEFGGSAMDLKVVNFPEGPVIEIGNLSSEDDFYILFERANIGGSGEPALIPERTYVIDNGYYEGAYIEIEDQQTVAVTLKTGNIPNVDESLYTESFFGGALLDSFYGTRMEEMTIIADKDIVIEWDLTFRGEAETTLTLEGDGDIGIGEMYAWNGDPDATEWNFLADVTIVVEEGGDRVIGSLDLGEDVGGGLGGAFETLIVTNGTTDGDDLFIDYLIGDMTDDFTIHTAGLNTNLDIDDMAGFNLNGFTLNFTGGSSVALGDDGTELDITGAILDASGYGGGMTAYLTADEGETGTDGTDGTVIIGSGIDSADLYLVDRFESGDYKFDIAEGAAAVVIDGFNATGDTIYNNGKVHSDDADLIELDGFTSDSSAPTDGSWAYLNDDFGGYYSQFLKDGGTVEIVVESDGVTKSVALDENGDATGGEVLKLVFDDGSVFSPMSEDDPSKIPENASAFDGTITMGHDGTDFYIGFDDETATEYSGTDTVWDGVDAEDAVGLLAVELSYDFTFAAV
jgi:hypothetical protein